MDFEFSDDQQVLRDTVRKWVSKAYPFERRRAIVTAGGFSAEAWREMAGLGLAGLVIDPAHGGLGFGPVEAMVVMEELGRGLVLEPYAHGALIAPAVLATAAESLQGDWLPRMAGGEALVVLAHREHPARHRLDRVTTLAVQGDGGWRLSGVKQLVPAGAQADAYLVPARVSGADDDAAGIALFLVKRQAVGVAPRAHASADGTGAAEIVFRDALAEPVAAPGAGLAALERAADIGIAAACAEAVGIMDALVALTAEHLNTRKQFGVPISSFQALRHRMADVKMQLELARSMSYYATLRLTSPPPVRRRAAAQAKLQLGESMRFVGQQCVQLHGGIGLTDEYLASHGFKRLTVLEMSWGDTLHQLGEVSARMQDTAGTFA